MSSSAGSTITEFRANVAKAFADGLEMKIVPGKLAGPNQTREWIGSCWLERVREDPARVMEQQVFIGLRCWAPFKAQKSPVVPYDPTPLEEMAEKILYTIAINQTGLGAWFQRVTSILFDPDNQGLEASIFAYAANPGVT